MTKVSASTLARQAAKTKNKAEAKRLRAKAAQMRRDEREAKRFQSSTVSQLNQPKSIVNRKDVVEAQRSLNQMRAASVDSMALGEQPGHGEIVGGYLAHMAEELAKLARKKGGVDAIQGRLMTLEHQNRHDEKVYAREREQKAVQAVREEMRDKIVCGFIAGFDAAESTGTMPMVWGVNSTTVASLVAALKANGYRAVGKR